MNSKIELKKISKFFFNLNHNKSVEKVLLLK